MVAKSTVTRLGKLQGYPALVKAIYGEDEDPSLTSYQQFVVETVILTLPDRLQQILEMRHGLAEETPQTFEMIGRYFGVTASRVRQVYQRALRMLRHPKRRSCLKAAGI